MIRSDPTLTNFIQYCQEHPEERFWQALRNWSGYPFIYIGYQPSYEQHKTFSVMDTFYWEGKRHDYNKES